MDRTFNYDSDVPKGKDVDSTGMLEPNAKEVSDHVNGTNDLKRDQTKHKPFGKLGIKGFPD